jgi:2-phospho-L-lactate guanylyltransferase (CobY/MobA/RfbA family)
MNGDPARSTGRLMRARRRREIVNAMLVDCFSVLAQILLCTQRNGRYKIPLT